MLENYRTLKRGHKTEYKKKLAEVLGITLTTVNQYVSQEYFPADYEETAKQFDKEYLK